MKIPCSAPGCVAQIDLSVSTPSFGGPKLRSTFWIGDCIVEIEDGVIRAGEPFCSAHDPGDPS